MEYLNALWSLKWAILAVIFCCVIFYFWYIGKYYSDNKNLKNDSAKKEKNEREFFKVYPSQEEELLDIPFAEKDVVGKLPAAKKLIENLREGKPFFLQAAEAIFIADKIKKDLYLDENGTLVIDKNDAIKVAEMIQFDPQDLVRYLLSIEKKLDPNNPKNKIPLEDFLYFARNAKNFNFLAYGKGKEEKDNDALVKIKTAIYESWMEQVEVRISNSDSEIENTNVEDEEMIPEVIFEQVKNSDDEKEDEPKLKIDPETGLVIDPNIIKIEKLDGDKVRIFTKSGKIIVKDDLKTYEYRDLVEEQEKEEEKNRKLGRGRIQNNDLGSEFSNTQNKDSVLDDSSNKNISDSNSSSTSKTSAVDLAVQQADAPVDYLALYKSQFGSLGKDELQKYEATRTIDSLRHRLRRYYDDGAFSSVKFSQELVDENKFFTDKDTVLRLFIQLFDVEYYGVKKMTQKKELKNVFFGSTIFKNDKKYFFRTVNIHFFLAVMYSMVNSKDKESFYQTVYEDFETVNESAVEQIIDCLNYETDILVNAKGNGYLIDSVYSVDGVKVKTKNLLINNESLDKIFHDKKDLLSPTTTAFYNKFDELRNKIGDSVKTVAYGQGVEKYCKNNDVFELDSEYFFRKKSGEA